MSEAGATGRRRPQGRVGTIINGKWHVDARLGAGGMATVYAATHRNGHRAALKMLHAQLSRDEGTRARFLREGYVANAVAHPGVCQVLDDDVSEDGAAFLVLELLEGETVEARRVRMGGRLGVDEAVRIARDTLATLAAAHEKGIVHRDIKPDNIFVTNEGKTKLLDFGLARMKDGQLAGETTRTGVTIGTPEFMPPEQAMGRREDVDAQSDLWALGACVFMMVTGRFVHDADSLHEQLIASATKRAPPVASLAPHVPPGVAHVIDRALELEKTDRWRSAHEMLLALEAALGARGAPPPRPASSPFDEEIAEESVTLLAAPPSEAPDTEETPIAEPPRDILAEAPRLRPRAEPPAAPSAPPPRRPSLPEDDGRIVGATGMPMPPPWRASFPEDAAPQAMPPSVPVSRSPETPRMHPFDGTAPDLRSQRQMSEAIARAGSGPPPAPPYAPPAYGPQSPPATGRAPVVDPFGLMTSAPPPPMPGPHDTTGRTHIPPRSSSSLVGAVVAAVVLVLLCAGVGAWVVMTRVH